MNIGLIFCFYYWFLVVFVGTEMKHISKMILVGIQFWMVYPFFLSEFEYVNWSSSFDCIRRIWSEKILLGHLHPSHFNYR